MREINSLNCPRFTSLVAIARIVSASTIISTITFVIVIVGVMPAYISSRRKKYSMRLKTSLSLSRLVIVSLAAWEPLCQEPFSPATNEGYRPRGEPRSQRRLRLPVGMPEITY